MGGKQIVGPLLYTTEESPYYHRGLIAEYAFQRTSILYSTHILSSLVCWIILAVLIMYGNAFHLCAVNLLTP